MTKCKRVFSIIITISLILLIGCNNSTGKDDQRAEIQLWWYDEGDGNNIDDNKIQAINSTRALVEKVKSYCTTAEVPLKLNVYKNSEISYENYVLKRNVNLSKKNVIIMDNASNLYELNQGHCDYNKIDNYKNLYPSLKNLSFIPLDMNTNIFTVNSELLKEYNINLEKNVISYNEYIDCIIKIKEAGGKLQGNNAAYLNLISDLKKEKVMATSSKIDEHNINKDKYKKVIDKYVNSNREFLQGKNPWSELMDKETKLPLLEYTAMFRDVEAIVSNSDENKGIKCLNIYKNTQSGAEYCKNFNFGKYKVVVQNTGMDCCFFIGKNVTNKNVYDIGNLLMSKNTVFNPKKNFNLYKSENKFTTMKYSDVFEYLGFGENGTCLFDNSSNKYNDDMIYDQNFKEQINIMYKEIYDGIFNDIKREYYDSFQMNMPVNQYIISNIYAISQKIVNNPSADVESEVNNMVNELKLKYK